MLTQEEMDEYVDMAERDELDPSRWELVDTNEPKDGVAYLVTIPTERLDKLSRRAKEMGKTEGEYLNGIVEMFLATA